MALFANEAQIFRFRVFFRACSLQNKVGDPPFFYISDIPNSSTYSGESLRKKSMSENFRANVLKINSIVVPAYYNYQIAFLIGLLHCLRFLQ